MDGRSALARAGAEELKVKESQGEAGDERQRSEKRGNELRGCLDSQPASLVRGHSAPKSVGP